MFVCGSIAVVYGEQAKIWLGFLKGWLEGLKVAILVQLCKKLIKTGQDNK